ncbi:hypothetical protein Q4485_13000 [Granulosicoccaceae sp. 1_MG-2023]|nr:hypothetical protein [Granulosicoccaceae sp. 1_MG-2023]
MSQSTGDAQADTAFVRDMGLTHADFFRYLPAAVGEHSWTQPDNNTVMVAIGQGSLRIELGPEGERRIANIRLPRTEIAFRFDGVTPEEQRRFLSYFDLRFQRGGG